MREKIRKLFELNGCLQVFRSLIDVLLVQVAAQNPNDYEFNAAASERVNAVITEEMPGLTERFIDLYEETYNENEIDAMLSWHNSPVGRKAQAMQQPLQAASMGIGQSLAVKIDAAVNKLMAEFDAKNAA